MYRAPFEVTQKSAAELSITFDVLEVNPRNSPVCTATRTTEKTI